MSPVDWSKYPDDWSFQATAIKDEADWCCEKCGKQCRRPGEPFDTHKNTLTVAHCEHGTHDPTQMHALCAPCHLQMDAQHHARTRRDRGQMLMFDRRNDGRAKI